MAYENNGYQQNGYDPNQNAYNQGYNYQQQGYQQGGYQQQPGYQAGGYQYNGYNQYNQTPEPTGGNGIAIAAMVTGILSLIFCWIPSLAFLIIAILLGLCGIILGALGMKKQKGKGMAIAGLVCGIIGFVIAIIYLIACASLYSAVSSYGRYLY